MRRAGIAATTDTSAAATNGVGGLTGIDQGCRDPVPARVEARAEATAAAGAVGQAADRAARQAAAVASRQAVAVAARLVATTLLAVPHPT